MPNSVTNNKNYPVISKSIEMHRKAKEIMHPVSQTLAKAPGQFSEGVCPVFVEKAKGNRIWDIDGNEFLDYYAAIGPISLGYGYDKVDDAIKNQLDKGLNIVDLIVLSNLANSKSEIRRLIKGNGVRINNQSISDEKLVITNTLFKDNNIKLSLGKKKHFKVKLS